MPVVLLVAPENIAEFRELLDGEIDELLPEPISRPELQVRINAMLRAHDRSLQAKKLHEDEIRLQMQATRLDNLSTNVPGMIYQFAALPDGSTRYEYASDGCRDIFEVEPEEVVADPMIILKTVHPEEREAFEDNLAASIADKRNWVWEGRYIINGKTKWIKGASTPHVATYGLIWDGVMVDVTDRKEAEEKLKRLYADLQDKHEKLIALNAELDRANDRLKGLDHAKSRFVSTATHELRTPLTKILSLTRIVRTPGISLPEEQTNSYLQIIEDESRRLSDLVEILLSISRLQEGPDMLRRTVFRVAELARTVKESIKMPEEKRMRISIIERNGGAAFADDRLIGLVMHNILDNAIRYTPAGGVIEIIIHSDRGKIIVGIKDQGPGVPPDQQELIFESFYRIREDRSAGGKGSGLGLSVASEIIKAHDEKIWVESTPGGGSTFYFSLPPSTSENQ
ncbi:MAG: PAS domain-containing protein [Chitinivibrionales bacterium]|nr:PAS domain-containing protein [Chitinivibrionales bacterium]MBD3358133.1 PAS domain-containing protein [Chitinivibrionales bacterium]